jgi:hypothetical protein
MIQFQGGPTITAASCQAKTIADACTVVRDLHMTPSSTSLCLFIAMPPGLQASCPCWLICNPVTLLPDIFVGKTTNQHS